MFLIIEMILQLLGSLRCWALDLESILMIDDYPKDWEFSSDSERLPLVPWAIWFFHPAWCFHLLFKD